MSSARLIVCERTGKWAAALRRQLGATELRPYETRTLDECRDVLRQSAGAFAVLELTAVNSGPLVSLLLEIESWPARAVVVAQRSLAAYTWTVREAGAIHMICSPRRLDEVVRMARRHLHVEAGGGTLRDKVWSQLPWKEHDTSQIAVNRQE